MQTRLMVYYVSYVNSTPVYAKATPDRQVTHPVHPDESGCPPLSRGDTTSAEGCVIFIFLSGSASLGGAKPRQAPRRVCPEFFPGYVCFILIYKQKFSGNCYRSPATAPECPAASLLRNIIKLILVFSINYTSIWHTHNNITAIF